MSTLRSSKARQPSYLPSPRYGKWTFAGGLLAGAISHMAYNPVMR